MHRTDFKNIAGVSWIEEHEGIPSIKIERDGLEGEVYLHGAHITSWKPADQELGVLFLSAGSHFKPGKAIRGGVPICFPWFGPRQDQPKCPQHGFARTRTWQLDSVTEANEAIIVELSDRSDAQSRSFWPFDFVIGHRLIFGATLTMELQVRNTSDRPFHFEEAQHTYLRVGDVKEIAIAGLDGRSYHDQTQSGERFVQAGDIRFTGELDQAYLDTNHSLVLTDLSLNRRISVVKTNSDSTVVWNPWIEKACALPDLGADQWQRMVCIETCNIRSNAISLAPGESHTMQTHISVKNI